MAKAVYRIGSGNAELRSAPARVSTVQRPTKPPGTYGRYFGCLWGELVSKTIAEPEKAGVLIAVNAAPFYKRGGPFYFIPAAIYDLTLELNARVACSQEVYSGK